MRWWIGLFMLLGLQAVSANDHDNTFRRFNYEVVGNLQSTQAHVYLLLRIEVVAKDEDAAKSLAYYQPAILDRTIDVIVKHDRTVMDTPKSREALQQEILKSIQDLMKAETKETVAEKVIFKDFVLE